MGATPGREQAAARTPTATSSSQPPPPSSPPAPAAVGDPLAVARAWISDRWTYHASDPAGWAAAMVVPSLSTPAFAARAQPLASDLARAQKAGESSTVEVTSAAVDPEAPNTAEVEYVVVAFTTTPTYTGAGSGQAQERVWSLRLTRTAPAPPSGPTAAAGVDPAGDGPGWLVDAVVIGD